MLSNLFLVVVYYAGGNGEEGGENKSRNIPPFSLFSLRIEQEKRGLR
jgi:hypothetical protein